MHRKELLIDPHCCKSVSERGGHCDASLSVQSMSLVGCPQMMANFIVIQDAFPHYAELEIELEKAAGIELTLDSPQAYSASHFVLFKSLS